MPLAAAAFDDADTDALVARARTGDQRAFGDLVQANAPVVFRRVDAILRNEHDAREVCQEAWLAVWQELPSFRGEARFASWVFTIASRRALDHLRKRQRWYDRFLPFSRRDSASGREVVFEPMDPIEDAPDRLQRAERREAIERALAALPPVHRAVLALREIEGLSYEEIASSLGIQPGTVMSRLHHARRLLARKLKDLPCD